MKEVTAILNNHRQSPRKVRLVAKSICGKPVEKAKQNLMFINKRASSPISKLLDSALANAKNLGLEASGLVVKNVTVDGGKILYRRMPVARGSAHTIRKRTSNVKIILSQKESK